MGILYRRYQIIPEVEIETCTLKASEFLRRFTLHILPKGFTRIRHYSILASAFKSTLKINIDLQIGQVVIEVGGKPDSLLRKCPFCKTGELHTVACFDQRGPPANWFNKIRKQNNEPQLA
jgi:hypothetical protein